MTSFVGRRRELAEVRRLLETSRLVTLTGIGGIGKTRLALRTASDLARLFDDGAWLVDLSALREVRLLASTVGGALGLADATTRDHLDMLVDFLADRHALLVLDTCEHLVDGCAMLAETLLAAAPRLRVLATSREPLSVPGEHLLEVAPLQDSQELFMARAAAVVPGFAITADNEGDVLAICRRLDGIPLAIELAAIQARTLPLAHIARDRLADARGRRTGVTRHQTLRAAIEWSHELCSAEERLLWARLSVFPDDFDLAAATEVGGDDGLNVVGLVARLVDTSILRRDATTGRYRMLDTIREFGSELAGDLDHRRRLHRDYFADLTDRALTGFGTREQIAWSAALAAEHANLRAALEYSLAAAGDGGVALRMAARLWPLWCASGMLGEGRRWIVEALSRAPEPTEDRAYALAICATIAGMQGDYAAAAKLAAEAEPLACDLGFTVGRAQAVNVRGFIAIGEDPSRAIAPLRQAVELSEAAGYSDPFLVMNPSLLAGATLLAGDLVGADELCTRAEELVRGRESLFCLSYTLYVRSAIHVWNDRLDEAAAAAKEGLRIKRRFADPVGTALCLDLLAWCAQRSGRAAEAARLIGSARAMWRLLGRASMGWRGIFSVTDECARAAREELGDGVFESLVAEGGGLGREDAVSYALGERQPGVAEEEPSPLTRREREIADLVAQGLSNRDIAERLVISKRTVDSHVEHIFAKLGCGSRAQIAVWAARRLA